MLRLALSILFLLLAPGLARAGDTVDDARAIGREGVALYEAGRWNEAFAKLAEADRLYHAPTLVLYMARCKSRLKKLVEAEALYGRVANEALAADASEQFRSAKADAQRELAEITNRIPKLIIAVTGARAAESAVALDGAQVAASDRAGLKVEPGAHTIVVTRPGGSPVRRSVVVAESTTQRIQVDLDAAEPPAKPVDPGPRREGSLVPACIAFGVGGAALGVGAVTGVLFLNRVSDLESRCTDSHCPAGDQPTADSAVPLSTVSTVGFVVAGVAATAGVVLLVVRPGGRSDAAVRARASVGSLAVEGRF